MAYKNIHEKFWTDIALRRLSIEDKYLFFYLITNPHAHLSGIYYIPDNIISTETGLSPEKIRRSIKKLSNIKTLGTLFDRVSESSDRVLESPDTLSGGLDRVSESSDRVLESPDTLSGGLNRVSESSDRVLESPDTLSGGLNRVSESSDRVLESPDTLSGGLNRVLESLKETFLLYDEFYSIIWVKNCLRYQLSGKLSAQQVKAVNNHLATLQPSYLIKLFLSYYKEAFGLHFFCHQRYPIRAFSENRAVAVSESVSETETVSVAVDIPTATDKIYFDFKDKKFKNLNKKIEFYKEKFSAVDIPTEILKMEGWLESNPKNKKSNYERFVFRWLCKAQDNAGRKRINPFEQI